MHLELINIPASYSCSITFLSLSFLLPPVIFVTVIFFVLIFHRHLQFGLKALRTGVTVAWGHWTLLGYA